MPLADVGREIPAVRIANILTYRTYQTVAAAAHRASIIIEQATSSYSFRFPEKEGGEGPPHVEIDLNALSLSIGAAELSSPQLSAGRVFTSGLISSLVCHCTVG